MLRRSTGTLLLLFLSTHSSLAQNSGDTAAPVETVTVTGALTPIAVDRIGSATTIVSREQIERSQARYLADVLRTVPGMAVSMSGGVGAQTQARVRGGEANHVLVLIDGVRVNDAASGDEFRWEQISTGNVERIEIVRGPQSALWGTDAIGAVVNIITRSDSAGERFDGYAESGANGTRNAGMLAAGEISDWTLSGTIERLDSDGTNISRTGSETDGASLTSGSLSAGFQRQDGFSLRASLRASDARSEFDPVDFVATGLPVDGNHVTDSDNVIGAIRAVLDARDGKLAWTFRAEYFDSEHRNLVDALPDSATASTRETFGVQADVALDTNELSVALTREKTDFSQRGEVGFGDPNQDQSLHTSSLVAEYRHLANDRLTWIFSSRFDSNSAFDDAVTGKVSLAYTLSDATRLRGSIGSGQKAPTFLERYGFLPAQFTGNPDLKPESSLAVDIGLDRRFDAADLDFSASIYWQELQDEIDGFAFDPVSLSFTAQNLPGTSKRHGIELTADWRISDAIALRTAYTFTDATEDTGTGTNRRELRRPRHAGSFSIDVAPPARRFDLLLIAEYSGRREDLFFPPFPEPSMRVSLADYWLVDLAAEYRLTSTIALTARASNLLDENYEHVYGYRTLGRVAYVGLRADLGR